MPLLVLSPASRESGVTLIPRPVEGEAEGKGRPAYKFLRLRDSAVGSAATTTVRNPANERVFRAELFASLTVRWPSLG